MEHIAIQRGLSKSISKGSKHIHSSNNEIFIQKFLNKAYGCNKNGIFDYPSPELNHSNKKWCDLDQLKGIQKLSVNQDLQFVRAGKIGIYTSAYEKGVLYIANPWFKDSQWQDWAYVEWGEDYGVCPVHLLAFIDSRALTKDIDIQGTIIEKAFFVATVHMVGKPIDTKASTQKDHGSDFAAHANSWLFYKSSKMRSKDNKKVVVKESHVIKTTTNNHSLPSTFGHVRLSQSLKTLRPTEDSLLITLFTL